MLSFEIGQRESDFYSERTESQTESQSHQLPYYNIDINFEKYDIELEQYLKKKNINYVQRLIHSH